MTREEIFSRVLELAKKATPQVSLAIEKGFDGEIGEDTTFKELGLDSLDLTEIAMEIEDGLDIVLEDETSAVRVGQLVDMVEAAFAKKGGTP